jgi:hypothetical protein
MNALSKDLNVSDVLRAYVRDGEIPQRDLWGGRLYEGIRHSIRLGLDTRSLASQAIDAILPLERYTRLFRQTRRAAVTRLLAIMIMCLLVRGIFGSESRFTVPDISFAVVWLALQSIIFAITFDDVSEEDANSPIGVIDLIRGYLTMGQLTRRESPLWAVIRRIRRDEMASGFDGRDERARVYLEELRRRVDSLAQRIEKSRWRFILAEIMTAVVTFICIDGLPILRWFESGSEFKG